MGRADEINRKNNMERLAGYYRFFLQEPSFLGWVFCWVVAVKQIIVSAVAVVFMTIIFSWFYYCVFCVFLRGLL